LISNPDVGGLSLPIRTRRAAIVIGIVARRGSELGGMAMLAQLYTVSAAAQADIYGMDPNREQGLC
jgi:hypothetical protein